MSTTNKESRCSSVPSTQRSAATYRTVSKKFLAVASLAAGLTMITVCSSPGVLHRVSNYGPAE